MLLRQHHLLPLEGFLSMIKHMVSILGLEYPVKERNIHIQEQIALFPWLHATQLSVTWLCVLKKLSKNL